MQRQSTRILEKKGNLEGVANNVATNVLNNIGPIPKVVANKKARKPSVSVNGVKKGRSEDPEAAEDWEEVKDQTRGFKIERLAI